MQRQVRADITDGYSESKQLHKINQHNNNYKCNVQVEVSGQYVPARKLFQCEGSFLAKSLLILQQWLIHSLVDERVSIWPGCRRSQGQC